MDAQVTCQVTNHDVKAQDMAVFKSPKFWLILTGDYTTQYIDEYR